MDRNIPISPEAFEEIESYLLRQNTASAQQAFEQRLVTDAVLQDGAKQVQLILTGIREVSLRASVNSFHNELPISNNNVAKISRIIALRRWLVAASIILVLAIGGWALFGKQSLNEKLYADYFQPDPGLISAMGTTDNYVFDKAMIDYKTGNYTAAITAWKSLLKNDSNNDTLNYFIGSSYIAMTDSKETIFYLQKVTALPQSYFVKDANWYTGLALLQLNRLKEATEFIQLSGRPQKQALLQQLQQASP